MSATTKRGNALLAQRPTYRFARVIDTDGLQIHIACPFCGVTHVHGWAESPDAFFLDGSIGEGKLRVDATRVSHCRTHSSESRQYWIVTTTAQRKTLKVARAAHDRLEARRRAREGKL